MSIVQTSEGKLKEMFFQLCDLTENEWIEIRNAAEFKKVKKYENIVEQDERFNKLIFLLDGSLRIYTFRNGREVTFNFFYTPRFVADYVSLVEQIPARFNIQALENSHLALIDFDAVQQFYEEIPSLNRVGRIMMEKVIIDEMKRIDELVTVDLETRYEMLLHRCPDITNRIPQKYIASYLGVTPEAFCRIKRRFFS